MASYEVLVVDDSAFMRQSLRNIIEANPNFRVVGIARNGADALEKVKRLLPHLVTMDVEMPEMDGLSAVSEIMKQCPVPIVMVSSLTRSGTQTALHALELGAVECVHKEPLLQEADNALRDFFNLLEGAVHAVPLHPESPMVVEGSTEQISSVSFAQTVQCDALRDVRNVQKAMRGLVELVVIGSSTGGPAALQRILPRLPSDLRVPVLVVQHMPTGFTKPLAERFNHLCPIQVKEAEDGEALAKGCVYIAPAGVQTLLTRREGKPVFELTPSTPLVTRFSPSVDVTLLSAAPVYRDRLMATILTGMGHDGTLGCKDVKDYGGRVIVQSEETCVVYGMPKSVWDSGYADLKVPLDLIAANMMEML